MTHLLNQRCPSFPEELQDQDGQTFDASSIVGKVPVVIFFYPQALTYGCTKEACSFRDVSNKPTFKASDDTKLMRIIGISSDSVAKQKEFATKNDLNYTLLADVNKEARKAFGVGGTALLGIAAQRVTFIIDRTGIVKAVENSSISMGAHTKLVEKWAAIFAQEKGKLTQDMQRKDNEGI